VYTKMWIAQQQEMQTDKKPQEKEKKFEDFILG